MKTAFTGLLAAGLLIAGPAIAQDKAKDGAAAIHYSKTTATVEAVDQATRAVTLKAPVGVVGGIITSAVTGLGWFLIGLDMMRRSAR